jgi:hypothetical protein
MAQGVALSPNPFPVLGFKVALACSRHAYRRGKKYYGGILKDRESWRRLRITQLFFHSAMLPSLWALPDLKIHAGRFEIQKTHITFTLVRHTLPALIQ